jgi:hypothetical protein
LEYQLVFAPGLEISPADFVTAWNEEVSTQEVAQAQLVPNTAKPFSGPVVDTTILVVTTVGLGLSSNALYDLIKTIVTKKKQHKHPKVTPLHQPDGTRLLVVEEDVKP